jgi:2-oxoglutarate dehydrogenase E1 component
MSETKEFTEGHFQELIDDTQAKASNVKRVLFCTGKIYFDLGKYRQEHNRSDTAIIRLEQLYPFPQQQVDALIKKYEKADEWVWVQEEPENMGFWSSILRRLRRLPNLFVVARPENPSPAPGLAKLHQQQQVEIVNRAFNKKFEPLFK